MTSYQNGNANITIDSTGTRVIEFPDKLQLDYPLNIDIRVSTKCSFGYNPSTNKAFCSFCHESARTDGNECDYNKLKSKLLNLPKGIELAIGSNELSDNLVDFLIWANTQGYICNLTVNQGHLKRDSDKLKTLIHRDIIKGLGISYRSSLKWDVPLFFLEYPNTIFHVIAGINHFDDVMELASKGVKKILVLGEKDFGFNTGKVDLLKLDHRKWFWFTPKLFKAFDVVSFDNLALEQLKVNRFFAELDWKVINQGEHSMYINAVDGYFSPSSRSGDNIDWDITTVKDYFLGLDE